MKFKIEIECDNAAFEDDPAEEIARILEYVGGLFEGSGCY